MADGLSAFSDEPHNNVVHHIQGCYIGKLARTPKETVNDPFQNAIMLTDEEAYEHDIQEDYERACLEYEVKGHTIYKDKKYIDKEGTSYVLYTSGEGVRNPRHKKRRLCKAE